MTKGFLKAKHWQLFLLTFGIPMILQIIMIGSMFKSALSESDQNNPINIMMYLYPITMLVFMFGFFGWFWAISIGLRHKIPESLRMKVGPFKFFFFFSIIYIFLFVIFFINIFTLTDFNPILFVLIFPFHFFAMFCIFYCLYFTSKTIKTIELNRKVTFADYAGEFFLIWFYPIGIWIIQPRINSMFEKDALADINHL